MDSAENRFRDLEDRHVVITGGTGGLGEAVVSRLLDAGAVCHVPYFIAAELESFSFREHPRVHLAGPIDLTEEATVDRFYADLPALWASVHCAGGFSMAPIGDTTLAAFRHQLDINLVTCFLTCRAAVTRIR
ncbi:MAG: SDR family NAD(P)-dependent oxidoreductase, partial [Acidobacteriota bacterium]